MEGRGGAILVLVASGRGLHMVGTVRAGKRTSAPGFVRDSFRMPAFLPASLHACRQAVGTRTSTVLHITSIRTSVVPGVGRTVLSVRRCGRDAAIPPTKFVRPYCRQIG